MKKIILTITIGITFTGCATLHEQCTKDDEWKRYGTYKQCIAEKGAEEEYLARSISAAGEGFKNDYNSSAGSKTTDYACMTDCQTRYSYSLCESKCSY